MYISVELSLYPLADDFIPPITTFIEQLKKIAGLEVISNTLSTQLFGEFTLVMAAVEKVLKQSFTTYGQQVLVAKFLNIDRHPSRIND